MQPHEFGQRLRAEKEAFLGSMIRGVKETFQTPGETQTQRLQSADQYLDKGLLSRVGGAMWDPIQAGRNASIVNSMPQQAMMGRALAFGQGMNTSQPQAPIATNAGGSPQSPPPSTPVPSAPAAPAPAPAPAAPAMKQAFAPQPYMGTGGFASGGGITDYSGTRANAAPSFVGAPMGLPSGTMSDGPMNRNPFSMQQHELNPGPGGLDAFQGLFNGAKERGGLRMPVSPSSAAGQAGQTLGGEIKNVAGTMVRDALSGRGGATSALSNFGKIRNIANTIEPFQGVAQMGMKALSNMPLKTANTTFANALVAMAVKRAAAMDKEAANPFAALGSLARTLPAAAASGAKMLGTAGKLVNRGSQNFLRATGNVLQGGGQVGQAVGGLAGRVGRFGQQAGTGILQAADKIPTRMLGTNMGRPIRDVTQAAGHALRGASSVVGGAGGGAGLVGKGMNAAGQGLKRVSQMGYGIPTAAAIPVAAGAVMAAKPFVPNVGLQNPVQASGNVNFRSPVTVNWNK